MTQTLSNDIQGQIKGLHHVTSIAGDARQNNAFFTKVLGLRRVKKTVNFDAPDVYHLYYGDEIGTAGSIMTYFPFPNAGRGTVGTGAVSETAFAVPQGALIYWEERLSTAAVGGLSRDTRFGQERLTFDGPDGDKFALVEVANDARAPYTAAGVPEDVAIRGFLGVTMRLRDARGTADLLHAMGYTQTASSGTLTRFTMPNGNGADVVDIDVPLDPKPAREGAGSVHHVAFAVEDRAAQKAVRDALTAAGHQITPPIDRDYFWAIYFRTPGGVLFEIATHEPGFDRDEDRATLGQALKIPTQHERLRPQIEQILPELAD